MRSIILGVVLLVASAAYGGVLYLELPPAYDADMVEHPTDADLTALRDFAREELGKLNNAHTCRVVIFTKNGKPVARRFDEGEGTDVASKPTTGHVHFYRGSGFTDGQWNDVWYHLHQVGEPDYAGVYGLAYTDVFGPAYAYDTGYVPPVIERDVTINLDSNAPDDGYYLVSIEEIYLKNWRAGDPYAHEVEIDTDRAYSTRLMLHAFRGPWPATWDHFGAGTVHAAWLEIQARLYRDGHETYFNDLGHYEKLPGQWEYERPYYTYFENFNVQGMATNLASFDSDWSMVNDRIRRYRYGACGYCWWKVLHHDPDFIKDFNAELCKLWRTTWPDKPTYDNLYWAAIQNYDGGAIEELTFADWFDAQPILQNINGGNINVCVPIIYKSKVEVFNYRRYEYNGEPCEAAVDVEGADEKLEVTKYDWDGTVGDYAQLSSLDDGYAYWYPTLYDDDSMFRVKAEYFEEQYSGGIYYWESLANATTFSVDSDDAYEDDEVFAVVMDAVNGGGWLDVSYNNGAPVRYVVDKKVARIPNFVGGDETGAGEYTFAYVAPGGGNGGSNSPDPTPTICKDGGCFLDFHSYLTAPGGDSGGKPIDDRTADKGGPASPPDLAFRPSPGAGDYRAPDVASRPGGNELGEPGADLPPMGDPALTSPGGFGGDEIEAGSAASPYGAGGVPAGTAARPPVACYPNPVTGPTTSISFAVKEAGKVRLAVYDISGRRVATLAEGRYPAGEYSAEWNADVPTGVYVYRLEAAGMVTAGKVVVAR